jgi:hypothetical protein
LSEQWFDEIAKVEAVMTHVSQSRCGVSPGQNYGLGLFGDEVDLRVCTKLGGDQYPAQLDQHVLIVGMRLGRVLTSPLAVFVNDAR